MKNASIQVSEAIISPNTLAQLLEQHPDNVRILDASYGMGAGGLSPEIVFQQMRISNAQYFDIDAIADHTNPLPHMLPQPSEFATAVGQLGIDNDDLVVVYDQTGIAMAASRVWWMFRVFGHTNVCVLDGGMPAWHAAGLPFETDDAPTPLPKVYMASFKPELVKSYEQMRSHVAAGDATIIDNRPHLHAGQIPNTLHLPAGILIDPRTRGLQSVEATAAQFETLNLAPDSSVITTCGSGVMACVAALALYQQGYANVAVYDGSWAEWSQKALSS